MADALGTPATGGIGVVSDEDFRLDLAGLIAPQTSSLAARLGVLWGPGTTALVTGTSATGTMTVQIGLHHWVTSRGAGDGVYLGAKEAAGTVNIAAAPGANSRIDVVYSKQNDSSSTISPDGSTGELYGVVTGDAAVSPVKKPLPVGAIELATVAVAAGATSTNGAGVTITNTAAQTVARGARVPVRSQVERDALAAYKGLEVYRLDTDTVERYTAAGWANPEGLKALRGVEMYSGAVTAVGSGVVSALSFPAGSASADTDGYFTGPSSPNILTIPAGRGGLYQMSHQVQLADVSAGRFFAAVTAGGQTSRAVGTGDDVAQTGRTVRLKAGDTVQLSVYHSFSGTTNVVSRSLMLHQIGT